MNELLLRRRALMMERKKSRLPSKYQEVEYIQSTGVQYIDTGVRPTTTASPSNLIKIIADAQYTAFSNSTATSYIVGTYNLFNRVGIFERPTTQNWEFSLGEVVLSSVPKDLNRHVFIVDGTTRQWSVDNVSGRVYPNNNTGDGTTIYIFAYNGGGLPQYSGKVKLYSMQIYDSITLVRNFVPAKRVSDGEAGMYDLVNGVFYTNQGSGKFIVGPNVN